MNRHVLFASVISLAILSGCATKRYGRMQPVTGAERVQYSCRDVDLEIAKVEAFQQQIAEGAEFNAASAFGILGDFGIGNSMERGTAEKSAVQRLGQLRDLKAEKGCTSSSLTRSEVQGINRDVAAQATNLSDVRLIPARTSSGQCIMAPADYVGSGSASRPAISSAMPRCGPGM